MKYFAILVLVGITASTPQVFGADPNVFDGTSSFERVPDKIMTDNTYNFELKFQYTESQYWLRNIYPQIEISPKGAIPYVHIDPEEIGVDPRSISRTTLGLYVDSDIPYDKIFLNVSFVAENRHGTQMRSSWMDSLILDIEKNHTDVSESMKNNTYAEKHFLSPLKQIRMGIYGNNIQCNDDRVLVLKKSSELYSCIKPTTVPKLFDRNWALNEVKIINTDTAELNSKLIKITGVIERINTNEGFEYHLIPLHEELPRIEYTGYDTLNLFATSDTIQHFLRNLDGKLVKIEGHFLLDDGKYFKHFSGFPTIPVETIDVIFDSEPIEYSIEGAKLLSVTKFPQSYGLNIVLQKAQNGTLSITIPRDLLDPKIGESDDSFFVLSDGIEVPYTEEKNDTERTLTINFDENARIIEIIGTFPL